MLGGRDMIKKFAQGGKIQYEISKWAVDTEADLVRNTDLLLQLAREINRHTRHYSDYLDMHSRSIKDTKLLAGFYREDNYNKEDK